MKKIIITLALLFGFIGAANAASICNLNSDVTNVRAGPSAQNYGIVDQVSNGYSVVVTSTTVNAAGYQWAKIRYNSFRYGHHSVETGWVDSSAVCY